jgi:hypothetical protein
LGRFESVYTMLGVPLCDVGCMVKPYPLSCILDLLVNDIGRALYSWFLDLGLGARCGTPFDEVVILCVIDIFYMLHVLRRMVACIGVAYTLVEEH